MELLNKQTYEYKKHAKHNQKKTIVTQSTVNILSSLYFCLLNLTLQQA